MSEFKKYTHVERLSSDRCEGLTLGECIIQPKLDGSNGSVWLNEEGKLCAGSRNRELSLGKDNGDFYRWMNEIDTDEPIKLRTLLNCIPYLTIYGEWMGYNKLLGAIKDYDPETVRHFWIFDVYNNIEQRYLSDDEWRPIMAQYNLTEYCVPILGRLVDPTLEQLAEIAKNNKFLLSNANHPGEGIVVKNYSFVSKYGTYEMGKIVLDEFVQEKRRKNKVPIQPGEIEKQIVEMYLTSSELSKTKAKIVVEENAEEFDTTSNKMIGKFIGYCWNDLLVETPNWVKKFKYPNVNFNELKTLSADACRKYLFG